MDIQEEKSSRKWDGKNGETLTVDYKITGTDDSLRAYMEFSCYIHRNLRIREGLFIKSISVDPKESDATDFAAHATWSSTDPEKPVWSGDTTCGNMHIYFSRETVNSQPAGAHNFNNAIEVENQTPKGCEVSMPKWEHQVKISYRRDTISNAYFSSLHAMSGTVNSSPIWMFRRGELLFNGAKWETKYERDALGNREQWITFTFMFTAKPNETLHVPNVGDVAREGHHHVWHYYEVAKDNNANNAANNANNGGIIGAIIGAIAGNANAGNANANAGNANANAKILVPKLVSTYVERIYNYSDFSFFGFDGP